MATDRATLGINTEPFRRGLEEARAAASAFGGKLKADFAGFGAQIAAAFTIGAAVSFFNTIRNELDRLAKVAQRFNETAESIQRVDQAASLAGSNIEQVAAGITKATRAATEATKGVATYVEIFNELGISAEDFLKMSLEEKILALSKAYEDAGKDGKALANIVELLGRSGAEMIPLLASGPEAIKEAFDDATVASNETVAMVEKVNDSLERTSTTLKMSFAPAFVGLGKIAATTFNIIQIAIIGVTGLISGLAASAKEAIRGNFAEAKRVLDDYAKATGDTTKNLVKQTSEMWSESDAKASTPFDPEAVEEQIAGAKKIEDLTKKVAEAERKAAFERLSLEEQLLRVRMDAAKAAKTAAGGDEEAALNARLEIVNLAKQEEKILEQIKRQEEEIQARRDELAAREAKFAEDRKDDAQKLFEARQKIADLEDAVNSTDIEEEKIRLQMELLDLKDAELKLADSLAEKERQRIEEARRQAEAEVEREMKFTGVGAVGSLRSVGGGGGVETADPARAMVREQQKATAVLERIEKILADTTPEEAA
jgi:hypothetical protein